MTKILLIQTFPTKSQRSQHFDDDDDVGNGSGVKKTLVLFLGGCTYAEISGDTLFYGAS